MPKQQQLNQVNHVMAGSSRPSCTQQCLTYGVVAVLLFTIAERCHGSVPSRAFPQHRHLRSSSTQQSQSRRSLFWGQLGKEISPIENENENSNESSNEESSSAAAAAAPMDENDSLDVLESVEGESLEELEEEFLEYEKDAKNDTIPIDAKDFNVPNNDETSANFDAEAMTPTLYEQSEVSPEIPAVNEQITTTTPIVNAETEPSPTLGEEDDDNVDGDASDEDVDDNALDDDGDDDDDNALDDDGDDDDDNALDEDGDDDDDSALDDDDDDNALDDDDNEYDYDFELEHDSNEDDDEEVFIPGPPGVEGTESEIVGNSQEDDATDDGATDDDDIIDDDDTAEQTATVTQVQKLENNLGENQTKTEELQEELQEEKREARRVGGFGTLLALIAMVFTAHQMSENPDGIFASCCRLIITLTGCFFKILLMPFRQICGSGHRHHGHMPVSTMDYGFRDPYRTGVNMELT